MPGRSGPVNLSALLLPLTDAAGHLAGVQDFAASTSESQQAPAPGTNFVAAVIISISLMLVFWNLQTGSRKNANTGSRYATVEALVDHGTFAINRSVYRNTIDKVKIGKDYVSSKPPVLPTYAAGVYWVYQQLTGKTIKLHEGDVLRAVGLFTGWLSHLVMLLFFWRLAQLLLQRDLARLVALSGCAFAQLSVAYSTTLNNHSAAAACALGAFYFAFRLTADGSNGSAWKRRYVACGLFAGFLPTLDLPALALSAAIAAYLLHHNWRRTLTWFAPVALAPIGLHIWLTAAATGSVIPIYLRRDLYEFAGSYWGGQRGGIDALREPKALYAFNMLLGHHGLFSMTPLFVYALIALVSTLRRRTEPLFKVSLVLASALLVMLLFYVFRTRNYGGWCVGMRWLVVIMPLLMLYFGLWFDRALSLGQVLTRSFRGRMVSASVVIAFAVSSFHVQDGLSAPYQFSRWHNFLEGKPNRNRLAKKLNLGEAHKKAAAAARRAKQRKKKLPSKK